MKADGPFKDFHVELNEILDAANRMEEALQRAGSKNLQERLRGLLAFGALEQSLNGIAEHCQSQDRQAEPCFRDNLSGAESLCMSSEHAEIERLLRHFRGELESATAGAVATISLLGRGLIQQIRAHIKDERKVLEHIGTLGPVTEELLLRYTESPD